MDISKICSLSRLVTELKCSLHFENSDCLSTTTPTCPKKYGSELRGFEHSIT